MRLRHLISAGDTIKLMLVLFLFHQSGRLEIYFSASHMNPYPVLIIIDEPAWISVGAKEVGNGGLIQLIK